MMQGAFLKCCAFVPFLFAILFLFLLASCGGGSGSSGEQALPTVNEAPSVIPRNSVEGPWVLDLGSANLSCLVRFSFSNADDMTATANRDFVFGDYALLEDHDGRDQLTYSAISTPVASDCLDDASSQVNLASGSYYVDFSEDSMNWYEQSDSVVPVATFDYLPQDNRPFASIAGYSVDIVSIVPDEVEAGEATEFVITVAYETTESRNLKLGFNERFRDTYFVNSAVSLPANSSDEIVLSATAIPYDWGEGNEFVVFVTLSPAGIDVGPPSASDIGVIPLAE